MDKGNENKIQQFLECNKVINILIFNLTVC